MALLRAVPGPRGEVLGEAASRTIQFAINGLRLLDERFKEEAFKASFEKLVTMIVKSEGRVILAGMGKSGHVARKISATLTSTGTRSAYLHPAEAGHGDLGGVTPDDIVVLLTRSGETSEFGAIIDYCKRFGVCLVAVTSRTGSTVGKAADVSIRLPHAREACANELTPTTSTTVQLVFGDALSMALMEVRGFSADDFYRFHPGGRLGSQLVKVRDIMARRDEIPTVRAGATMDEATVEMTRARLGGTAIVDASGALIGVFTDGDLRRAMSGKLDMADPIDRHMNRTPLSISPDALASEAVRVMQDRMVLLLFVCEDNRLIGAIHMHDLLRAAVA